VTLGLVKLVAQIQVRSGWRLLFLKIDAALCPKDVATQALNKATLQPLGDVLRTHQATHVRHTA